MRWGAGAGASRLISGNMEPHRRLEERLADVQGLRGGAAVRLRLPRQHRRDRGARRRAARSSSPTSSTTPASSTAAGSRRAETFVYRHGDLEHLAWGLREAGGRGSLIVTDGVFSMDGDVAPLRGAGASWRARHGCRLMVDEAHATGALGPGGRGSVAAAGLSGEVDVVVGHARQGARLLRRLRLRQRARLVDYLLNTRPLVHLLDRAAAAGRRGGAGGAGAARVPARTGSSGCRRNAATLREALAAEGLAVGRLADPDRAGRGRRRRARRWSSASASLERGVFAQGIRPPTVPEGSSRLRFTVMATHRAGELRAAPRSWSAAPPASSASPLAPARPARRLSRAACPAAASSSPGPAPRSARPSSPPSSPTPSPPRATGRRLQARGHRPRRRGRARPRAAAPRRRLASRATRRSPPTATGRRPRPISRRRWPARRSTPRGCSQRRARRGGRRRRARLRGRRRPARAARARLPRCATSRSTSACRSSIAASPGLGTINHTLLTIEAARGRRPRGRRRSSSPPGPSEPSAVEQSNRETIAALGEVEVETLPRSTWRRLSAWPALGPARVAARRRAARRRDSPPPRRPRSRTRRLALGADRERADHRPDQR